MGPLGGAVALAVAVADGGSVGVGAGSVSVGGAIRGVGSSSVGGAGGAVLLPGSAMTPEANSAPPTITTSSAPPAPQAQPGRPRLLGGGAAEPSRCPQWPHTLALSDTSFLQFGQIIVPSRGVNRFSEP